MILVSEIKLGLHEDEKILKKLLIKKLNIKESGTLTLVNQ